MHTRATTNVTEFGDDTVRFGVYLSDDIHKFLYNFKNNQLCWL